MPAELDRLVVALEEPELRIEPEWTEGNGPPGGVVDFCHRRSLSHLSRPPNGGLFLRGSAARLDAMNVSRLIPWICLSGLVAGCDGAPSRNILGSYFPSWMVCALVGIVLALVARAVLKVTGLLQELPAPLVVLLALGCAVNFAMWLVWLA